MCTVALPASSAQSLPKAPRAQWQLPGLLRSSLCLVGGAPSAPDPKRPRAGGATCRPAAAAAAETGGRSCTHALRARTACWEEPRGRGSRGRSASASAGWVAPGTLGGGGDLAGGPSRSPRGGRWGGGGGGGRAATRGAQAGRDPRPRARPPRSCASVTHRAGAPWPWGRRAQWSVWGCRAGNSHAPFSPHQWVGGSPLCCRHRASFPPCPPLPSPPPAPRHP